MRWSPLLLYSALLVFLASAVAIMLALESDSPSLAILGGVGNLIAAILFILSVWIPRHRVDWDRIRAEQRLWESGPLGRKWLRMRRRLYKRWKL
jgi:protein-S-isoprenylcysteine O-methyltransferase Ste14